MSYLELHAFAESLGVPRRAFDRDHYDLPADRYPSAVWLGAVPVTSRDIVSLLVSAGLRRPKHLHASSAAGPTTTAADPRSGAG